MRPYYSIFQKLVRKTCRSDIYYLLEPVKSVLSVLKYGLPQTIISPSLVRLGIDLVRLGLLMLVRLSQTWTNISPTLV